MSLVRIYPDWWLRFESQNSSSEPFWIPEKLVEISGEYFYNLDYISPVKTHAGRIYFLNLVFVIPGTNSRYIHSLLRDEQCALSLFQEMLQRNYRLITKLTANGRLGQIHQQLIKTTLSWTEISRLFHYLSPAEGFLLEIGKWIWPGQLRTWLNRRETSPLWAITFWCRLDNQGGIVCKETVSEIMEYLRRKFTVSLRKGIGSEDLIFARLSLQS